ncbi:MULTISPECIES: hypothetical protein [unclassified Pseudomonas]|uniref:hypothetical protein n=1 Tax=unclassified Pseudomonas TaxID=196821 RepID=UPI00200FD815|nr:MULTISPECIES: hypothetical protein [unclassified Pseudomonas]
MTRSLRLQKKLHSLHLLTTAEEVVRDSSLVEKLWALKQGDRFELNRASFRSWTVQRYRLEFVITRGPVRGHWLHKEFDATELELFFTAKNFDGICHGWILFDE